MAMVAGITLIRGREKAVGAFFYIIPAFWFIFAFLLLWAQTMTLERHKEAAKTTPSVIRAIPISRENISTENESKEETTEKTWREQTLEMYLDHQPIDREAAWWLDVSPQLADTANYRELFADKTGHPVPKDWQDQMKYWREIMYPTLYEKFKIQLPEDLKEVTE